MLYHYCSVEKCYSILKGQNLRLSDIKKSNDYQELGLFFPGIILELETQYNEMENPFFFVYRGLTGEQAMSQLTLYLYDIWKKQFEQGTFSDYVVCFSEDPDSLGQWRGYANNACGCSIGFSKELLEQYCLNTGRIIELQKVEYKTQAEIQDLIKNSARDLLNQISTMRSEIALSIYHDDDGEADPRIDPIFEARVNMILQSVFIKSLRYKSIGFMEEKEWRMFFTTAPSRNPKWLLNERDALWGSYKSTRDFVLSRIDFMPTENDLVSFCPISFNDTEFSENPIKEIWLGPKNRIVEDDINAFLQIHKYDGVTVHHSDITYR